MSQDQRAPLAQFAGARPDAPAWFSAALANAPERRFIKVDGANIESLSWGERGKPGLLFLHGNGATADWWSFIAPFFADTHRVAAMSWSGMGGSDHRAKYSLDTFVAEAFGVAEAEGLFEADEKPVFAAHSFGGFPLMGCAGAHGHRLKAAVMVDSPVRPPGYPGGRPGGNTPRAHRVYETFEAAMARFRFAPEQGCENMFIADHIARTSLKQVEGGWTWKFDAFLWTAFDIKESTGMLDGVTCPFALMWGDRSKLMPPEITDYMRGLVPNAPWVIIPDAEHHVMIDQPLAFVTGLRGLLAGWPSPPR